jgi:hypothetical protein
MKATRSTSSVTLEMGKGSASQYIYTTGYYYRTGLTNWTPVTFTSAEPLVANSWYPKTAHTTLSIDSTQQTQDTYTLGYLCSWTGSAWKCGCRDAACTQSYWQIQQFRR